VRLHTSKSSPLHFFSLSPRKRIHQFCVARLTTRERDTQKQSQKKRCVDFLTTKGVLVVELGAAPVAALLIPLDAVTSAQTDPVRNRFVLVDLLGVLLLHGKRLEAAHLFGMFLFRVTLDEERKRNANFRKKKR
jgi:hypothetical protein